MENLLVSVNYPVLNNPEKVPVFFEALIRNEIPTKFTFRFLSQLGFPSSSDRPFVDVLKFLGIIDGGSAPTQNYVALRDPTNFHSKLGELIQSAYVEIFSLNKDVALLSTVELSPLFLKDSKVDLKTAREFATTFKSLCAFGLAGLSRKSSVEEPVKRKLKDVNISFSINLPVSSDPKFYKEIFKGLFDALGDE